MNDIPRPFKPKSLYPKMLKNNKYPFDNNSLQKNILESPFAKRIKPIDQLAALKYIPNAAQ